MDDFFGGPNGAGAQGTGGVPDDVERVLAALNENPGLLARVLAPVIGAPGGHYTEDGFFWPFDDLDLKCPRCPMCGARNAFPVIGGVAPMAMCEAEGCEVLAWNPALSAQENLASTTTTSFRDRSDTTQN